MLRICISIALVTLFAAGTQGEERVDPQAAVSPHAIPVNDLLERIAQSPLERGEAELLKAIAEMLQREPAAVPKPADVAQSGATFRAAPADAAVQLDAVPTTTVTEPRERYFYRLKEIPVATVVRALQDYRRMERESRSNDSDKAQADSLVIVPLPVANAILVSGLTQEAREYISLVAQFDNPRATLGIDLWIAEVLTANGDDELHKTTDRNPPAEAEPNRNEEPAAWMAWCQKHHRVNTVSRPKVRVVENETAGVCIGCEVPRFNGSLSVRTPSDAGLSIELTPTISSEGLIVIKCDIKRVWFEKNQNGAEPVRKIVTAQKTLSAKVNQTVWLDGLTWDGKRPVVIALTPRGEKQK